MNNIETICKSIIDNANAEKEKLILSSRLSVDSQISEAHKEIDAIRESTERETENMYNEMLDRSINSAKMSVSKLALSQKQKILGEIFSYVTEKLCNLETEEYQRLIENLLIKYSQEGDGISLSADTKVDEDFITNLDVFKERNLRFMYHKSDIEGGFVLHNEICDTIVSFRELVEEYREANEYEIIQKLFA